MFNLPSIKRLDLGLSKLQGTIPYDFVNVKKLEHLDLHGNEKITGQLPSCFGNLCKLKTLDLSGNNFSGNIDGFLGNFPTCLNNNLESLALHSYNKLIGKIPDSLGIFGSLRQLSLGYNFFGGSIPASIGKLSSLQLLHLSYKEMNGTIPKSIGQLSELVCVCLDFLKPKTRINEKVSNKMRLSESKTQLFKKSYVLGSGKIHIQNALHLWTSEVHK